MKKIITLILLCYSSFFVNAQVSGYSVEFDGKNDFIEMEKPLTIGQTDFSIELWIKVPSPHLGQLAAGERVGIIFGNYNDTDIQTFNFELFTKGRVRLYWRHGEVQGVGRKDLRDNKWHHIIVIRNKGANKFTVFIDGKEDMVTESSGTDIEFKTTHRVGGDRRNGRGGPSFHGQMDEIRVWKTALTLEEIKEIEENESIHDYNPQLQTKLLLYYQCEPGAGEDKIKIIDLKGDNHGLFKNF